MIKRTSTHHGFTLVEMLLVLVILATLAAIVIPKLAGRGQQAKETAAQTQISGLQQAVVETYEVDTGSFPVGNSGLNALVDPPANVQGWKGPYMNNIPNDPWGQPYVYVYPGKINPSGFDIVSGGPNMRVGDEDDIDNGPKKK